LSAFKSKLHHHLCSSMRFISSMEWRFSSFASLLTYLLTYLESFV